MTGAENGLDAGTAGAVGGSGDRGVADGDIHRLSSHRSGGGGAAVHALKREHEAARNLLHVLREIIGDDDALKADVVEGQTRLFDVMGDAVLRVRQLEVHAEALLSLERDLYRRRKRLEDGAERIRIAVRAALELCALRSVELPMATVTIQRTPPQVIIVNSADIPAEFWKQPAPTLDTKLLKEKLKSATVPGARLGNGGEALHIKTL